MRQPALLLLLSLSAFLFIQHESRADAAPPNIVFIMADDMGYETVTANGGESYKTPHLDRLPQTGMRFTQAHSLPVCTPTRLQVMSGRYNSRNYVAFGKMPEDTYTFANRLQEAGYKTFIGGKWQLGGGLQAPHKFGFDEYCLWQLGRRPNRYPNPGLSINGKQVDFNQGEYGPDIVADHVLDFIDRHQDEPFLVYYPMMLPHWPFEPTPDSEDWDPTARRGDAEEQGRVGDPKYFADMVQYADKNVGRVVSKLDELGIRENTLVVFTGDNGCDKTIVSKFDGRQVTGGKYTNKDNGTHVPLIVNWPGTTPAGKVDDHLICFTSFFPTFAEVAGAEIPKNRPLDGQSIAPLVRGEAGEPREWLYMWWSAFNNPGNAGGEFARTQRYKLYGGGRFIDLEKDPQEKRPLAVDKLTEEQQQVRAMLQEKIDDYTREGFRK